jgi:hypothetical protein
LFAGSIAFFRVNMHTGILEARLEETRLREKIIAEKNIILS